MGIERIRFCRKTGTLNSEVASHSMLQLCEITCRQAWRVLSIGQQQA